MTVQGMRAEWVAIEIGASLTNMALKLCSPCMIMIRLIDKLEGLNCHLGSIGCGCAVSNVVSTVMELMSNYSLRHQNSRSYK